MEAPRGCEALEPELGEYATTPRKEVVKVVNLDVRCDEELHILLSSILCEYVIARYLFEFSLTRALPILGPGYRQPPV
jgi:hypothetical protein